MIGLLNLMAAYISRLQFVDLKYNSLNCQKILHILQRRNQYQHRVEIFLDFRILAHLISPPTAPPLINQSQVSFHLD
jgi:hypothetical protein